MSKIHDDVILKKRKSIKKYNFLDIFSSFRAHYIHFELPLFKIDNTSHLAHYIDTIKSTV